MTDEPALAEQIEAILSAAEFQDFDAEQLKGDHSAMAWQARQNHRRIAASLRDAAATLKAMEWNYSTEAAPKQQTLELSCQRQGSCIAHGYRGDDGDFYSAQNSKLIDDVFAWRAFPEAAIPPQEATPDGE